MKPPDELPPRKLSDTRCLKVIRGGRSAPKDVRLTHLREMSAYKRPQMTQGERRHFASGLRAWVQVQQRYLPKHMAPLATSQARRLLGEFLYASVASGAPLDAMLQVQKAFEDAISPTAKD